MKEFTTAAKSASSELLGGTVTLEFKIDGKILTMEPPTSGQFAYLIAMQAENVDTSEQVAAIFEFLSKLMSEEDYHFLRGLLRDGRMDMNQFSDILEWLVEQWAVVPTSSAPASSSPPRSTGRSSTAKRRSTASTS